MFYLVLLNCPVINYGYIHKYIWYLIFNFIYVVHAYYWFTQKFQMKVNKYEFSGHKKMPVPAFVKVLLKVYYLI